jgi:hypothetical protein
MVFDSSGQNLYISNSTGTVRAFNLSTLNFGTAYEIGGHLNGLDVARDNSFVLVAQNDTSATQGTFHRLDLGTGAVTNVNYTRASGEGGAWDVAIASNGLAFATTHYNGSGWTPLRQIDLTTNAISIRSDAPGSGPSAEVRGDTQVSRNADATRLAFFESSPLFTYSATANSFGPAQKAPTLAASAVAISRTGSLVALSGNIYSAPNLSVVQTLPAITNGVAFNAAADILYGFNYSSNQIIAYNTQTYAELFRFTIPEAYSAGGQFGPGLLVASADGNWVALSTTLGIRLFQVSPPKPPPTKVVSRKLHGGVPFDIDLPVLGDSGIECRSGGTNGDYQIILTFPNAVTFANASVTAGTGSVSSASGNGTATITLNLTGVTSGQKITLTLFGVNDGTTTGDVGLAMRVLVGDVNGDGRVNSADATQLRSSSGQTVSAGNYRLDLNGDGAINSADATIVRSRSGNSVP